MIVVSTVNKLISCTTAIDVLKMRMSEFNDGLQFIDMSLMAITGPDVREVTAANVIASRTILCVVLPNPMSLVLYNECNTMI